jgi:hypothetical protein
MKTAEDYQCLSFLAGLKHTSRAKLARNYLLDGMRRDLDPENIKAAMQANLERQLTGAETLRKWRNSEQSDI